MRDAVTADGRLFRLRHHRKAVRQGNHYTLDIIHVAAAPVLGTKEFVTFDGRQGALAKQVGLTVKP